MKLLSRVWLFVTPWTVAYQAPPSMGFSRQEYWSGLPFPSPGDLPNPGTEPGSPAFQADALTSEPPVGSSSQLFSWLRFKKEEHSFCDTVKYMVVCALSRVRIFVTLWTAAHQAPLSRGFSRQEDWSRLPFPTPGDLPNLEIKLICPMFPTLAGRFFYHWAT